MMVGGHFFVACFANDGFSALLLDEAGKEVCLVPFGAGQNSEDAPTNALTEQTLGDEEW